MKNKKFLLLALFAAVCTFSCTKDEMPSTGRLADRPYYMSVENSSFSFGSAANLGATLVIESMNVSWEITGAPSWLTLSANSGSGDAYVTLTASENKGVDEMRVAVLLIKSTTPKYEYSREITITQAAATAYLNVEQTSLSFAPQVSTTAVTVNSNIEWEATCSSSWITFENSGNETLLVTASENLAGSSRSTTISLRRIGTTKTLATIDVTQSEGGVTGSTEELAFGLDGGTKSVEIDAEVSWSTTVSNASWLAVTPESGTAGKAQLKITALANKSTSARSGFVYVKIGTKEKLSIPVSQEGVSLEINGTLQEFAAAGGETQKLNVVSNKEWKILSCPEWLYVTPEQGDAGTVEVSLEAVENRSVNSRSATLRIGVEGITYKDIAVSQGGLHAGFDANRLEFAWESSQQEIGIDAPNSWNATVSHDWLSLSQYTGNGSKNIIVTVQTNDDEYARYGTITVITEGRTFTLSVVQQGQYIRISSTAGEVAAMGGTVKFSVQTSVGAADSVVYEGTTKDWLTFNNDGNGNYTLTAAYNPSVKTRTAQFVIKPSMATTNNACTAGVKYQMMQAGRALLASVSGFEMFAAGGTSATYTVTADGKYSISKPDSDNWYELMHDADAQTFYIVVSKNTIGEERNSQITISLDELPAGEEKNIVVDVLQHKSDYNINVGDFDEDRDWDTADLYEYVDLGLPSGVKWAAYNVGAGAPHEYGDYYAWGEIETKTSYTEKNCSTYGKTMSDIRGNAQYDVARAKWGGTWRLPTKAECEELIDEENCTWEWTTQSGVNGCKVTSKVNGNSIFLPAAGYRNGTSINDTESRGNYWSSTPRESNTNDAYYLGFYSKGYLASLNSRYCGFCVRPVTK